MAIWGILFVIDVVCEVAIGQSVTGWISSNVIEPVFGYDPVALFDEYVIDPYVSPYIDPLFEGAGEWLGENIIAPIMGVLPPGKEYFDQMFGGIYEWMEGMTDWAANMTEWANAMTEWAASVSQYLMMLVVLVVFAIVLILGVWNSTRKLHKRDKL